MLKQTCCFIYIKSYWSWMPFLIHCLMLLEPGAVGKLAEWDRHCPVMSHLCSVAYRSSNCSSQESCWISAMLYWIVCSLYEQNGRVNCLCVPDNCLNNVLDRHGAFKYSFHIMTRLYLVVMGKGLLKMLHPETMAYINGHHLQEGRTWTHQWTIKSNL